MKHKSGRRAGPLTIVAAILVLSAGLRLVGISTEAFALDVGDGVQGKPDVGAKSAGEQENLDAVLESFRKREANIKARETEIEERLKALNDAETSLGNQLAALEAAEARLRELLSIANTAAEDDVARLTAVYENMKPKEAATVFEQMQPEFASGFLARMRPDSAAAIMAGLSPQSAYAISVTLAGRHTNPQAIDPGN